SRQRESSAFELAWLVQPITITATADSEKALRSSWLGLLPRHHSIFQKGGTIMSKYAGTKTEKNLMDAFAGESQARNKYTYYASAARKAGFVEMANIFEETANQEKEHAKMWFKEFSGIGTVDQ